MTVNELKVAYNRHPFEPFTLYLADGRTIPVHHPEFITVPPSNARTFSVYLPEEDAHDIIDLLLVVSIKHIEGASNKGSAA